MFDGRDVKRLGLDFVGDDDRTVRQRLITYRCGRGHVQDEVRTAPRGVVQHGRRDLHLREYNVEVLEIELCEVQIGVGACGYHDFIFSEVVDRDERHARGTRGTANEFVGRLVRALAAAESHHVIAKHCLTGSG